MAFYGRVYYMEEPHHPPVAPEICRKCERPCVHYGDTCYARICQDVYEAAQAGMDLRELREIAAGG